MAALYNSRLLDTWFRAVNGNAQVSATELRAMPLPAHGMIVALGQRVKRHGGEGLDALVTSLVPVPRRRRRTVASVEEAREIPLGMPPPQRNEMSGMTLALRADARRRLVGCQTATVHLDQGRTRNATGPTTR